MRAPDSVLPEPQSFEEALRRRQGAANVGPATLFPSVETAAGFEFLKRVCDVLVSFQSLRHHP